MTQAGEKIEDLVQRATEGDRGAVDGVLRAIQDDVYRLALRMLGHPAEAEDATQEILLKVLTNLGGFQGKSAFRTWVWRIACNHVLTVKRSQREVFSFELMEGMVAQGLAGRAAAQPTPADIAVLEQEVKLGCTEGMILSLDREHRVAFVLGEIFELPSDEAAAILEIEPAAYRKRLQRGRDRLAAFMLSHCGLVDRKLACRCSQIVPVATKVGFLDPTSLLWRVHGTRPRTDARAAEHMRELDDLQAKAMEVHRDHPDYAAPDSVIQKVRGLLGSGRYRLLDA